MELCAVLQYRSSVENRSLVPAYNPVKNK
jgi:hypothetical protein